VSYGLLKNIKISNERKETMGPQLQKLRLGVLDTSERFNEWYDITYDFFYTYLQLYATNYYVQEVKFDF
jgi:hypothetical protein